MSGSGIRNCKGFSTSTFHDSSRIFMIWLHYLYCYLYIVFRLWFVVLRMPEIQAFPQWLLLLLGNSHTTNKFETLWIWVWPFVNEGFAECMSTQMLPVVFKSPNPFLLHNLPKTYFGFRKWQQLDSKKPIDVTSRRPSSTDSPLCFLVPVCSDEVGRCYDNPEAFLVPQQHHLPVGTRPPVAHLL